MARSSSAHTAIGGEPARSPTQASLRRLLIEVLRDDADLNAFCSDHFRNVKGEFSQGMLRSAKLTLLLEKAPHAALLAKLQEFNAEAVEEHAHLLRYDAPNGTGTSPPEGPAPAYADERMRELGERLASLHRKEEELRVTRADAKRLQEVIQEQLEARRAMRRGPSLQAGEWLGGRYHVLEPLGRGGFGTVWKAFDRTLRQVVAIKVLLGDWMGDRSRIERFDRGARLMAGLDHPGIVPVLATVTEEGGFHYFVMRYLDGGDLYHAVLERRLDQTAALEVILQAGAALHFAHERGVVHRDVKPQNILLDSSGTARLTDFDLAAAADTTGGTRTGALGTFLYSSPEAMRDASTAGPSADVYSLAMTTLFVLLGRELPFDVIRTLDRMIDRLPCRPALKRLLRDATAWEVAARIRSARTFCERLQDAMSDRSTIVPFEAPLRVGILAAEEDYAFEDELLIHLKPFLQKGNVHLHSRLRFEAGISQEEAFAEMVGQSHVILVFVSASLYAGSAPRTWVEKAIERASQGKAALIPLLIRACTWEETALGAFSPMPENGTPVALWRNPAEAWLEVAERLNAIVTTGTLATEAPAAGSHGGSAYVSAVKEGSTVFIVRAEEDGSLAEELSNHLNVLAPRRKVQIRTSFWMVGMSPEDWGVDVRQRMSAADVILLLLSAQFLATEQFGLDVLHHAASLQAAGNAQVWLIRARPVFFEASAFPFNIFPEAGTAIDSRPEAEKDQAWADVCRTLFLQPGRRAESQSHEPAARLGDKPSSPVRIALIYAEEDAGHLTALEAHMSLLVGSGKVTLQRHPIHGENVGPPLDQADVVLWLVSVDLFVGLPTEGEIAAAHQRAGSGRQTMVVIRLRPVDIMGPLEALPALPRGARFITQMPSRDEGWRQVVEGIHELCGL